MRHREEISLVLGGVVGLFTALSFTSPRIAQADEEISGEKVFQQYCAACHGMEGKGDGPLMHELKPKTPDLTLIAKRNGGTFPYAKILEIIDGRSGIRSHGSGQMPVWGEAFALESDEHTAHARVLELVLYLESIQGGGK